MHRLVITRAYYQVGSLTGLCDIHFTTEDGGDLKWSGFINGKTGPVLVEVPGDGQLFIEHSQMCTVSITTPEKLMYTNRMIFQEVKLTVKAKALCGKCGKMCTRTKVVSQTINPFNTNPDGTVKTRDQILTELQLKAAQYRTETIYHVKCED
ncbi:hypothetical protein HOV23_gp028 [Pseudomonas phage Lana]|uniref:Uncharacterized protein n=1 Tax=Pseudomonas phage Lana TaxID=2530172 RepID=A0A481W6E0_9CAUD|nr:hypothetical protein HOV23_gp028 [Pseudomonas phage Lana]QBJ04545.1 hypothetical protein [Pseudomonas phage Lana]